MLNLHLLTNIKELKESAKSENLKNKLGCLNQNQ